MKIKTLFFATLLICSDYSKADEHPMCGMQYKYVELEYYPARDRFFDGHGNEMRPRKKLKKGFVVVELKVRLDQHGRIWKPQTIQEAAFGLKDMLPSKFYKRMKRENNFLMALRETDDGFGDRVSDLSKFIEIYWHRSLKTRLGDLALARIIEYIYENDKDIERCASTLTAPKR